MACSGAGPFSAETRRILFTPTGAASGYNTAIEDAVNLGWKLASVVKGVSPAALLDSYEIERRPVALRNTDYARRLLPICRPLRARAGDRGRYGGRQ